MPKELTALENAVEFAILDKHTAAYLAENNLSVAYHAAHDKRALRDPKDPEHIFGWVKVNYIADGKANFSIRVSENTLTLNALLRFMEVILKEVEAVSEKDEKGEYYYPIIRRLLWRKKPH